MPTTISPIPQGDLDASIQKCVWGLDSPFILSLACNPYNLRSGQKRHWGVYLVWWNTHVWNLTHHGRCPEATLCEETKPHSKGMCRGLVSSPRCWDLPAQEPDIRWLQPLTITSLPPAFESSQPRPQTSWSRQAVPTMSFPNSGPENRQYHQTIVVLLFYSTICGGLLHSNQNREPPCEDWQNYTKASTQFGAIWEEKPGRLA